MRYILALFGFSLCCQAQPVINAVTNAASYSARVSPGSVVTIFGTGFADSVYYASDVPLPLSLGGVDVIIGGYSAPMLYVDQYQVNFIVPYEVAAGAQQISVADPAGASSGITIQVDAASPGIFQYSGRAFATNYSTGALNATSAPVTPGDYLIVYLTGIGPLSAIPADGDAAVANPLSQATLPFTASIGGFDAPIAFLGLTPDYVGLAQANIVVPNLPSGEYPLSITVGGVQSTSAVVSVSGSGTPPPSLLTFRSVVGIPTNTVQTNILYPSSVQPNGRYVYVCTKDQIAAVDVSSTTSPALISLFGQDDQTHQSNYCTVNQNYLVSVENNSVVKVFDVASSPTQPPLVAGPGTLQNAGASAPVFSGNTAIFSTAAVQYSGTAITSEAGVVETYDFSNYANPVYGSTFAPPSGYTGNNTLRYGVQFLTTGAVAVLGTTNTGGAPTTGVGQFTVVDVTDPTNIQGITEITTPEAGVLQASALEGSLALIAGNTEPLNNTIFYDPVTGAPEFLYYGNLTLSTVDFSSVDSPAVYTTVDTGIPSSGTPTVVSLGGGYFAVAIPPAVSDYNGPSTLGVVDATDAAHPQVYPFAAIEGLSGMAVQDGILYATSTAGVTLYTIASF